MYAPHKLAFRCVFPYLENLYHSIIAFSLSLLESKLCDMIEGMKGTLELHVTTPD